VAFVVRKYMDRTFSTVDIDSTVRAAAQRIAEGGQGFALVLERGVPTGVVSAIEIVSNVVANALDTGKVSVRDVMTPLVSVDPDDDVINASKVMLERKRSLLAVMRDGIVYGVVTAQGVAERSPELIDLAVRDIIRWGFPWKP
jgi:CBS domain-containing protein